MNDPDEKTDFIFGQKNIYHQIGDGCLQNDITTRKADNIKFNQEAKRMIKIGLAYCFKEPRLATTGSDLKHNKYVGQVSTITRLITNKDGNSITCIDRTNESKIDNIPLKQILSNNHEKDANKGEIRGQLPLE